MQGAPAHRVGWIAWLVVLLGLAAEQAWTLRQQHNPAVVLPANAPLEEFSATRARQHLESLLEGVKVNAVGTPEHAEVRGRLLAELSKLGYAPSVQTGVSCGMWAVCARVNNLIAELPGAKSRGEILLAAHYDSVPAGPGAADDGQGTASLLEIARSLRRAGKPEHGVVFLFTDGEELGLLGAKLFMEKHPAAKKVRVVLNLEARGSRGPSLMFQTSANNANLIRQFAQSVEHPVASSLFPSVYRKMPNDTDLTELMLGGAAGYNFAFIRGVDHYHTPLDSLEHLDFRSVQHQGTMVLALARSLTRTGPPPAASNDAVFFDWLGLALVRYPQSWAWLLLVIVVGLLGTEIFLNLKRRVLSPADFGYAAATWPALLALPALVGFIYGFVLTRTGALPTPWIAKPLPLLLALALLAPASAFVARRILGERLEPRALASVTAGYFALLALIATLLLPGASFAFTIPALAASAAQLSSLFLAERFPKLVWPLRAIPLLVVGALWLPSLNLVYEVIGFFVVPAIAGVFALPLTALAPWLVTLPGASRWAIGAGVLSLVSAASLFVIPSHTTEWPARLSLAAHYDVNDDQARFLVDTTFTPAPAELERAVSLAPETVDTHPWPAIGKLRAGKLKYENTAAPEVTISEPRANTVAIDVAPSRAAWAVELRVPQDCVVNRTRLLGVPTKLRREGEWQVLTAVLGSESSRTELDLGTRGCDLVVTELRLGLPPSLAALEALRPKTAVPSQFGDATLVSTEITLPR
jgi:hypothetical protein